MKRLKVVLTLIFIFQINAYYSIGQLHFKMDNKLISFNPNIDLVECSKNPNVKKYIDNFPKTNSSLIGFYFSEKGITEINNGKIPNEANFLKLYTLLNNPSFQKDDFKKAFNATRSAVSSPSKKLNATDIKKLAQLLKISEKNIDLVLEKGTILKDSIMPAGSYYIICFMQGTFNKNEYIYIQTFLGKKVGSKIIFGSLRQDLNEHLSITSLEGQALNLLNSFKIESMEK